MNTTIQDLISHAEKIADLATLLCVELDEEASNREFFDPYNAPNTYSSLLEEIDKIL